MARQRARGRVTDEEMERMPSEYGGRRNRRKDVEISGDAASQRSDMVRSDPNDPRSGVKKR